MQVVRRAAVALALAVPLVATQVSAQRYHWDASLNGGGAWYTNDIFTPSAADVINGTDIFTTFDDVDLGGSVIGDAQLGYWFGRSTRFGVRAHGAYSAPDLQQGDFSLVDDVNLWHATGDLMFRIIRPRERWRGFEFLPYAALGAGATWFNPPSDNAFLIRDILDLDVFDGTFRGDRDSGVAIQCSVTLGCFVPSVLGLVLPADTRTFFIRETGRFTGLGALGADLRFAPHFAVRAEVGDRLFGVEVSRVDQILGVPTTVVQISESTETINQIYGTLGVNFLWGLERPPRRVVTAPPPRPAPPPPPATEQISVCVVDPTVAGGLRIITATYHISTGDTTVMMNGRSMELSSVVGNIPVAANATWYVSGAPLEIGMAPNRLVYTTIGSARMIEPSELAFLGTVNGMPVYADRTLLTPLLDNLGPNTDLNRVISESADVRRAFESVTTIYVPLQPIGCVFQALQKQQEVRKGKD